jgi:hypothetical protein
MNWADAVRQAILNTTNKFIGYRFCTEKPHEYKRNVVFAFEVPQVLKGVKIVGYKAVACVYCGHCTEIGDLLKCLPPSMDAALAGESDVGQRADKSDCARNDLSGAASSTESLPAVQSDKNAV